MPWGIIGSVVVATVLYVAVSAVLTGVAKYSTLNNAAPVATTLAAIGAGWIGRVILVASVIALTKGLLMIFYGQTRLVFAMARDGLLPKVLCRTSSRGVPMRLSLVLGVVIAVVAVVSVLAIAGCIRLATTFEPLTWLRFVIWSAAGAVLYLIYGQRHSTLATERTGGTPSSAAIADPAGGVA
jgi:APA family basic amino acid/polyamine antiporter